MKSNAIQSKLGLCRRNPRWMHTHASGLVILIMAGCGADVSDLLKAPVAPEREQAGQVQDRTTASPAQAADASTVPTYRSFDGTGNNAANMTWGSTGVRLRRAASPEYADGISAVGGNYRPGARQISNVIADQGDNDAISDRLLSAMIYAWGQFIDHDIGLTPTGGAEVMLIPVPLGDPSFDPFNTGTQVIPTTRSIFDIATGLGADNPRQQVNVVTAWLDGSMVYGSDAVTAQKLRTLSGGRMKTSPGNMLPLNNSTYFPDGTLPMANDAHLFPDDQMFAAGDVRANENIELVSLHTLFVRNHNYWAGRFAAATPSLSDTEIYQRARATVIAEIESITFNEWLPAMLGRDAMPAYSGYDPTTNPNLVNEFSTAAFRFGHSLLGDDVEFLDNDGNEVADEIPLSQAFFNPAQIQAVGIDPILKYLASDPASELDNQIVNSVRNFLFGPPGSGGLDLASLNIQRGRDHGLADYNSVRVSYGIPRARSFAEISPSVDAQSKLASLFTSVDDVDLWVGLLAEGHVQGASVGPTLKAVVRDQFKRLRAGDRFWYQRTLSGTTLARIENTTLADVIRRNTRLTNLQKSIFFFRAGLSGTVFGDVNGDGMLNRWESPLPNRTVELVAAAESELVASGTTGSRGRYEFDVLDGIRTGDYFVRVLGNSGQVIATSRIVSITRGEQFLDRLNIPVP